MGCVATVMSWMMRCAVAVPVGVGLGAHHADRRLPLAQQRQGRRGQVPTATTTATGLACFIFRFLRRPPSDAESPSRQCRGQASPLPPKAPPSSSATLAPPPLLSRPLHRLLRLLCGLPLVRPPFASPCNRGAPQLRHDLSHR